MNDGEGRVPGAELRQSSPSFPKRFYKEVRIERRENGFEILLDGRPARTPGRNPLALPTEALADAVRSEWDAVETTIDPRTMPLTRLVNSAIDGVSRMQSEVLAEAARFAGSDLLAYRASEPEDLVRAQRGAWDPVVEWARDELRAPLMLSESIMHIQQPARSLDNIAGRFATLSGEGAAAPFRVAALHVLTTLTGSALLALAVASNRISAEQAWSAAHVDEDHEIAHWGEDEEASQRRLSRWAEMRAAADLFALSEDGQIEPRGPTDQPT